SCRRFFFSSRRRHTRSKRDWSSDVCSSDLQRILAITELIHEMNPEMSLEEARTRATQSNEVTTIDYRDDLRTLITEEGQAIIKITFVDADPENTINQWQQKSVTNSLIPILPHHLSTILKSTMLMVLRVRLLKNTVKSMVTTLIMS